MAVLMQAVQPVLPPWLFKLLSTAIRLLNNVVGGMSFVRTLPVTSTLSELLGLHGPQKVALACFPEVESCCCCR